MTSLCVHCNELWEVHYGGDDEYRNACPLPNDGGWHPTNRFTPRPVEVCLACGKSKQNHALEDHSFTPRSEEQAVVDWPNSEGIWMGLIPGIGWFPLKAKRLKTYDNEAETKMMPFVAQFPESKDSWPFTFQGCHPAKRWRVPTNEELAKAKHFYGE